MSVVIKTTIGDFKVDLFTKERPRTCMNFLKLCKLKYYNLQPFFKVCFPRCFLSDCDNIRIMMSEGDLLQN